MNLKLNTSKNNGNADQVVNIAKSAEPCEGQLHQSLLFFLMCHKYVCFLNLSVWSDLGFFFRMKTWQFENLSNLMANGTGGVASYYLNVISMFQQVEAMLNIVFNM